jgi:uncharacterized protein
MRRVFLAIIFYATFSSISLAALHFPALTGHVVDEAGVISVTEKRDLEQLLSDFEHQSTDQVVVVTLQTLQGTSIEDYGYQLGRAWGIGQKSKDNGVLLIVAPHDRKVRIEVGYGLEPVLTDAICSHIIQSTILPAFRTGHLEQGIVVGANVIVNTLHGDSEANITDQDDERRPSGCRWQLFLSLFSIL